MFGTVRSIRKVFFVVLFMKVLSGRLEGIVLSVIMLRFQYSFKLSFSHKLASVYLYVVGTFAGNQFSCFCQFLLDNVCYAVVSFYILSKC